ncbi:hypothetical protein MIMGU_mgv1a018964mg, partial [Erythranthe guttata]
MVPMTSHSSAGPNKVDNLTHLLDQKESGEVDSEAKNAKGETALHVAAKNGSNEAAKKLLDSSACVDAKTNKGKTPHNYLRDGLQNQESKERLVQKNVPCKTNNPTRNIDTANQIKSTIRHIYNATGHSAYPYNYNFAQQIYNKFDSLPAFEKLVSNRTVGSSNIIEYLNKKRRLEKRQEPKNETKKGKMDERKMVEFEDELSKIVGLNELKQRLRTWAKGLLMDEKRRAVGIKLGPRKPPHMVFLGNPGTGKTTIARILGKLLESVGVLSSDKVVEVQRTDLVGEHIGHTRPKTKKKIKEAMGGILFVDEAYRLAPWSSGRSHDFGMEALEEIMSVLEDGDIVVIFAGYTEPMKRVFSSNAGFCRRVTHFFQFDDFTCKDLAEMVMIKMTKLDEKSRLYGFKLDSACTYDAILQVVENNSTEKLRSNMNGGLVDHMLNNARENLDLRLNSESE